MKASDYGKLKKICFISAMGLFTLAGYWIIFDNSSPPDDSNTLTLDELLEIEKMVEDCNKLAEYHDRLDCVDDVDMKFKEFMLT